MSADFKPGPHALGAFTSVVGASPRLVRDAVLVLSCRHRLWQRYGPDGLGAIEAALVEMAHAMDDDDLVLQMVYVDDGPVDLDSRGKAFRAPHGLPVADVSRPDSITQLIGLAEQRALGRDLAVKHVLIIGDDGVIPHARLPNPSPDDDGEVLSDLVYARGPDGPSDRGYGVGRLPDCGLDFLLSVIHAANEAHRRPRTSLFQSGANSPLTGRRRRSDVSVGAGFIPVRQPDTAFGYSASIWRRAARQTFQVVGNPRDLRTSPPLTEDLVPAPGTGARLHFYNLHGLSDSPNWFGQRDPSFPADYPFFPVALTPHTITPTSGCVVFSEACHGARITGRSPLDSIALRFLAQGAAAFVGATGTAYGGLDSLVAADVLAYHFLRGAANALSLGTALSQARALLETEAQMRQGSLDTEERKALLNFVLYGDPSLALSGNRPVAEGADGQSQAGAAGQTGSSAAVGTPAARSLPLLSTSDMAGRARSFLSHRLPELASPDVRVTCEPLSRHATPKDYCQPMIVTLRKSIRADSTCYPEIVRVTMGPTGQIIKVALSR